jgi:nucleoid-associated protein Lsr2
MASKTVVEVIDDLDGSKAEETIRFALDGAEYEIDLSGAHSKKLRDALQPYLKAGRRVGGKRSARHNSSATDGKQSKSVREWAKQHGMQVSDRGRVSAEVQKAYDQAP